MTDLTDLTERLRWLLADATPGPWKRKGSDVLDAEGGLVVSFTTAFRADATQKKRDKADPNLVAEAITALPDLLTTIETLTQEVERLRGLLIDPSDPAWEDARAVLVAELRKAGMDTHADNVAAGHAMQIPSWIALNLIAHSRKFLTQENARLKAVSQDHFRNAQRLAGEVAKRDVENARLREAGWRDIETIEAHDKCLLWCSDIRWEDQRQPEGGYKRVNCPVGVVMGSSFDYLGDGRITVHGLGMNGDWTFTHWMPLPPSPARKTLGGGDE